MPLDQRLTLVQYVGQFDRSGQRGLTQLVQDPAELMAICVRGMLKWTESLADLLGFLEKLDHLLSRRSQARSSAGRCQFDRQGQWSDQCGPITLENYMALIECAALFHECRTGGAMPSELSQQFRFLRDLVGFTTQTVGQRVAVGDAGFIGGRECSRRRELVDKSRVFWPRGLTVKPDGLDELPAVVAAIACCQESVFGGDISFELERLQPRFKLMDRSRLPRRFCWRPNAVARLFPGTAIHTDRLSDPAAPPGGRALPQAHPARELGQGGIRSLVGTNELTTKLAETTIEVAGLASLIDDPSKRLDIERFFQPGEFDLLPSDLIAMAGDYLPGNVGLTAEVGKPLCRADDHRLIGPKSKRLRLVQIDRSAQVRRSGRWCSASCW